MHDSNTSKSPMETGLVLYSEGKVFEDHTAYRSMIGSLIHSINTDLPDLLFAAGVLSRYVSKPAETHWVSAKRVLKYVAGTLDMVIKYKTGAQDSLVLCGYVDADYASCVDDQKSTTGYVFIVCGAPVSWSSKKQPIVATSTVEAEYIAAFSAVQEAIWLKQLLKEMGIEQKGPTTIFEDNNGCISMSKGLNVHTKIKHMDVRYYYVRQEVSAKNIELVRINTGDNIADLFTKALAPEHLKKFAAKMSMGMESTMEGSVEVKHRRGE